MTFPNLAAIVLCAGFSSRMEQFKPLMSAAGESVLERVISLFRQNDINVHLVTGWRQQELVGSLRRHDITIVENPDFARAPAWPKLRRRGWVLCSAGL